MTDDADYERVSLDDWASVEDPLRGFAEDGEVIESDESIAVTVGNALLRHVRRTHRGR